MDNIQPERDELPLSPKQKLLSATARISWKELEPFFAKGDLIWVASDLDLVLTALAIMEDDGAKVSQWLQQNQLAKVSVEQALQWLEGEPELWSVVAAPWVLVQEKTKQ